MKKVNLILILVLAISLTGCTAQEFLMEKMITVKKQISESFIKDKSAVEDVEGRQNFEVSVDPNNYTAEKVDVSQDLKELQIAKEKPKPISSIEEIFPFLKKELKIDFSPVDPVVFPWNVLSAEQYQTIEINGQGYEFETAAGQIDQVKIWNFFENNDFKMDLYNVGDATLTSFTGYQKDNLVCLIENGVAGEPDVWDREYVKVSCGILE